MVRERAAVEKHGGNITCTVLCPVAEIGIVVAALARLAFGIGYEALAAHGVNHVANGVAGRIGGANHPAVDVKFTGGGFADGIGSGFNPTEFSGLVGGRLTIRIGGGNAETGNGIICCGGLAEV